MIDPSAEVKGLEWMSKGTDRRMEDYDEKRGVLRGSKSRNFRNFFASGLLLSVLVWGSSFLLLTINNFRESQLFISRIDTLNLKEAPHIEDGAVNFYGGKTALNFSAVRDGVFRPKFEQLQWIKTPESINNDRGTYVLKEEIESTTKYSIKSIVDEDYEYSLYNDSSITYDGIIYKIDKLVASPDLSKAIISTNSTHNWRHSTFALYWLLDVSTNKIKPIFDSKKKIAVTSWSPSSKHIAYVFENNVYLFDIERDVITQVTDDGNDEVFYGKPDWVYEEEVFASDLTLWWSPNGDKFTFLKLNDTQVPEFTIPYYVQSGYEDYPEMRKLKYPKPGYSNPIVDLLVFDVSTKELNLLDLNSKNISEDNRLITEVVWVNSYLLVKTSNRASDLLEIFLVDTVKNYSRLIRSHVAKDSWFEITSNTLYVPKNETLGRKDDGYIDTIVQDGFNHLAYFSPPENPHYTLLTRGNWEVVGGVEAFDYVNNEIYFQSTFKSSIERHIYSVNLIEALENLPTVKNITSDAGWNSGSFSSGSRYLLLKYEGPQIPYQKLVDLQELKDIRTIQSNDQLAEALERYALPESNYQVIDLIDEETGDIIKANAIETLPLNFNPARKYPVLFYVYGGPGAQLVEKKFAIGFSQVVAAELDSIVVTVDGRGTGFNNHNENLGSNYKFIVRDRLGHYEPLDQIAAAKYWAKKPYVDSERIAIWGWSYGGFLTLKTLETDSVDHVFSYGVAIAPVTKWKLYDSIYTERYMRTPQENPEGYEIASIHDVSNFVNVKKFLIGHGSGDDNVHIQNTLKLIDDFNIAKIENFDFMIFPDSDHSITYHNGNNVVYDRILDFFRRAFSGEFV